MRATHRQSLWPALLLGTALGLCLPEGDLRAEDDGAAFGRAVERLVKEIAAAAPEGIVAQVSTTTPSTLGWEAGRGTPAVRLVLIAPSGAERALGLLPRQGRYAPLAPIEDEDPHPALIAIGPDLVVVAAPTEPPALTLEAVEAARAGFEQALRPLGAWSEEKPIAAKELGAGLDAAIKATRYPHHVAVVLPLDAPEPDAAEAFAAGISALTWSRIGAEGIVEPPTIVFSP